MVDSRMHRTLVRSVALIGLARPVRLVQARPREEADMRKLVPWAIVVGALVLSSVGGAVAASQITGAQIKNATITGEDVRNKSLTPSDFRGSLAGPQGPRGASGAQGPQGPAGASGTAVVSALTVQSGALTVAPGDVDGGTVYCPAGQRVVSGGFASVSADGEVFLSIANDDRTGWIVALDNFDSYVEGDLLGEAYCAASGQAVAASPASQARSRARSEALLDRLVA